MSIIYSRLTIIMVIISMTLLSANTYAAFMDVTSITPGNSGGFTGQIGSISVVGSLSGLDPNTTISPLIRPDTYTNSVIDGSSLQYSYKNIYTPSNPSGDKVGYIMGSKTQGTELLTITFSEAITNPIFHIANLDSMVYDFSPSGLTVGDLTIISGNGGADGDGLVIDALNPIIKDGNPLTIVAIDDTTTPPTFPTARSGYGSVVLTGSYTTLQMALSKNPLTNQGDGGSFQISTIPIPPALWLFGSGLLGLIGLARKKNNE